MNSLLKAENLVKTYRKRGTPPVDVLKSLNFEVFEGDKIAILGASGEGKSTLLHILGTLESPSGGLVTFQDRNIFKMREKELSHFRNKTLGFVFQFHYLLFEFTALENVMMPALIANEARAEARTRAKDLLNRVGLSKRLHHKPNQLSGGEQQRVAIARALMMKPKILLTDEMTGNLDPETGREVFQLVLELQSEMNTALVSVTHDEVLARSYPRIFRLHNGLIESK